MPEKIKHIKDNLNNKLEKYKIKQGLGYINNSTQDLCAKMKISVEWTAKNLYKAGVSANVASLIGFAIGLLAINFLALNLYFYALLCVLLNRLFDSVDGAIARKSKVTEFGVFLDATLDYVFYTGVIFGFALANPQQNAVAAAFLLFAFAASACAMLAYAMIAYKYKTFDYLAKPITYERLEDTVKRLFDDIYGLPKKYIKIDNKNTLVDETQIQYIKRDGMKLKFHTSSRDYESYSSFNKIQDSLPDNFVRCHKSYIVNLNNIKNVDPVTLTIYFDESSFCSIGPKYKKEFMEVIKNHGIIK